MNDMEEKKCEWRIPKISLGNRTTILHDEDLTLWKNAFLSGDLAGVQRGVSLCGCHTYPRPTPSDRLCLSIDTHS